MLREHALIVRAWFESSFLLENSLSFLLKFVNSHCWSFALANWIRNWINWINWIISVLKDAIAWASPFWLHVKCFQSNDTFTVCIADDDSILLLVLYIFLFFPQLKSCARLFSRCQFIFCWCVFSFDGHALGWRYLH